MIVWALSGLQKLLSVCWGFEPKGASREEECASVQRLLFEVPACQFLQASAVSASCDCVNAAMTSCRKAFGDITNTAASCKRPRSDSGDNCSTVTRHATQIVDRFPYLRC